MASVAVVGVGVIGLSWARLFDGCGWTVTVSDLRDDLDELVAKEFPGGGVEASTSLESAADGVDFVQESAPEDLEVKRQIFRTVADVASPTAILASSSSSLLPSKIGEGNRAASRIVVGHPFNPPYLMPLVEVVPGGRTSAETVGRAAAIYRSLGRVPVTLRKEIPGFLGNRLQTALRDQAVYLVQNGYATVEDIDTVMTNSLGPRWAALGPFATMDLGGGAAGPRQIYANVESKMTFELGKADPSPAGMEPIFTQIEAAYGVGEQAYARKLAHRDAITRAVLQAQHVEEPS